MTISKCIQIVNLFAFTLVDLHHFEYKNHTLAILKKHH